MGALSVEELTRISAVVLTHLHFDHVRDIPSLGLLTLDQPGTIDVYSLPETLRSVHAHLLDGEIYPDLTSRLNDDEPALRFNPIEIGVSFEVNGYQLRAVSADHPVPAIGYVIDDPSGARAVFTGDSRRELDELLSDPLVELLFADVTFPDRLGERADLTGHLTPARLRDQLQRAAGKGVQLPRIVVIHRSTLHDEELAGELEAVAKQLKVDITIAQEGMVISTTGARHP